METIFAGRPDAVEVRRLTEGWRWARVWLPVAIACCVIAMESTKTMSSEHTSRFLRPFLERLFGHMDDLHWSEIHHLIRKSGHFIGYGLVCLTWLRAWLLTLASRTAWSVAAWRSRSVLLAVACTSLVAGCDEWHQTLLPGRTGQFSDVVLDACGGTVMCLLVAAIFGWRRGFRGEHARGTSSLGERPS
jgi:VanZ family protein